MNRCSANAFKKVTHVIFDLDGVLLGKYSSIFNEKYILYSTLKIDEHLNSIAPLTR